MNASNFFRLNWFDVLKSFLVAFLAALVTSLTASFESGALPTMPEFLLALKIALIAGVSYLIKNVFTNSDNEVLKKEGK